ncbi:efflux RND transporter periplasmic adaptor subunit [Massilia sp. CF038]|uniref:efflux RND transporter periplasmic adaptor subunit n=1 Tax=Massilia sp. CF038 TaxID=1881045 RepID=UPI000910502E|nr:efflux RND transporter periplasmic adaptor subunit [Massilia sp. CF038]SHG38399.1 RND family efflux transporter, MFP subunit [Massilia sp. CF038]
MKLETLPSAPVQPTVSKKRWRAPVIGVVVLALGAGGWYAMQSQQKAPAAAAAKPGEEGKVAEYELSKGDVVGVEARALSQNLPLSGSLIPLAQATVKSKVSGVVLDAELREGTSVAAGQVLARLDQADLAARVAQQQAMLDEANARLALATKNSQNSQALLSQKYISQQAHDTTQNAVDLARASVKAAQAQLQMARIALNDTVIRAPMAGVISRRHVQAGEKLSPDMPVFTIVDLRQMTLEAQVPASEIPRVKIGQDVQFKVDGFAGRSFAGKVARINPSAETGSRAMLVYISVNNADRALSGGMFAKGQLTTHKSAVRPLVPVAALRKDKDADVVYKIEGGKVVLQPVKLGMRNDDEGLVEVTDGLSGGASLLIGKLEGVKPGTKVRMAGAAVAPVAESANVAKKG